MAIYKLILIESNMLLKKTKFLISDTFETRFSESYVPENSIKPWKQDTIVKALKYFLVCSQAFPTEMLGFLTNNSLRQHAIIL